MLGPFNSVRSIRLRERRVPFALCFILVSRRQVTVERTLTLSQEHLHLREDAGRGGSQVPFTDDWIAKPVANNFDFERAIGLK